jgi:serine/threonine protein kinase
MPQTLSCPGCQAPVSADAPGGLCPACLLRQGLAGASEAATAPPPRPQRGVFGPLSVAELSRRFPQLEIIELLGQGGLGAVYKARQPHLDRLVALKILPPDAGADQAFAERFGREARALARLNHPGIVGIHDFGRSGELYYLVMEYVDGVNLRRLIQDRKLQPAEALKIVPQLCDALQYAHDEGVVHRDIKPENVLLDRKGRVKVADFGLAKMLHPGADESRLTGTGQVMGTWRYMAPEQLENPLAVDHRADIYSLGVLFYELLTGELPVGRFAVPSEKVNVDVRLDEVVLKALENEPERRYQHASEVKTAVEAIAAHPASATDSQPVLTGPVDPWEWLRDFARKCLSGDEKSLKRAKEALAALLGTAGTVVMFAWMFELIPGNVGLFLFIACYALAGGAFAAATGNQLASRLKAARAIRDPNVREASLAQLALDAADEADGKTALQALGGITSPVLRDKTAVDTALKLADVEQRGFATQAAQAIADPAKRNEVLGRLG